MSSAVEITVLTAYVIAYLLVYCNAIIVAFDVYATVNDVLVCSGYDIALVRSTVRYIRL